MTEIRLILCNQLGLHARPASKLAKIALKYDSEVLVSGNNKSVDAKSISMIMTLGFPKGTELKISVDGPDESDCIEEMKELIENNFYEE